MLRNISSKHQSSNAAEFTKFSLIHTSQNMLMGRSCGDGIGSEVRDIAGIGRVHGNRLPIDKWLTGVIRLICEIIQLAR
jgi:hypothetical protein